MLRWLVHRFSSHLPGGSASTRKGASKAGGYCILDCIYHELDETFFVLDMMAWKVQTRTLRGDDNATFGVAEFA